MNIMRQAEDWLNKQRNSYLSELVIYISSDDAFTVSATRGRTIFRTTDNYGATIRQQSADFLISVSALPKEPERGDEIIANNRRYEVLAPNNEPVWRYSGVNNQVYRIHTKEMGSIDNG